MNQQMQNLPVMTLDILTEKNLLSSEPIYIGDADEGEEGLCGYKRIYKHNGQIYITTDFNSEHDEELVATMSADFYNENF